MDFEQRAQLASPRVHQTGRRPHLYAHHFDQARLQLTRAPLPRPVVTDRFSFGFDDIAIGRYDAHDTSRRDRRLMSGGERRGRGRPALGR